jgi:hypothetical protein
LRINRVSLVIIPRRLFTPQTGNGLAKQGFPNTTIKYSDENRIDQRQEMTHSNVVRPMPIRHTMHNQLCHNFNLLRYLSSNLFIRAAILLAPLMEANKVLLVGM